MPGSLVSCCMECNSAKRDSSASDSLRSLYRDGRLTAIEFKDRRRPLAAGKLRPLL